MIYELSASFMIGLLECQRPIPNVSTRTPNSPHCTLLLSIWFNPKFIGLQALHDSDHTWPMKKNNDIRHGRHCIFKIHVHLVFVTKYRRTVFTKEVINDLREIFAKVCADFEAELVEFDGEHDHVHLLVNYPPKAAISKLVNSLKGVSSRVLRRDFKQTIEKYYWKGVLWSPSYFAGSCGGAPIDIIKKYIENQKTPKN